MFDLCRPNIRGLLQGEHPEILAQSDPPPVDLSVGDIRSQIKAKSGPGKGHLPETRKTNKKPSCR